MSVHQNTRRSHPHYARKAWGWCFVLALLLGQGLGVRADALEDAQALLRRGQYAACVEACLQVPKDDLRSEDWTALHTQALLAQGRYPQAEMVVSNVLSRAQTSVRLRWIGLETAQRCGLTAVVKARLQEINELGGNRSWSYREAADLVALGRVALRLGADPKTILERLFEVARKADPRCLDAWLATGEMALEKHDYALAAKTLAEAQAKFPDEPDVLQGLARAYQPNARGKMLELLHTALKKNENHVPSMLLLVDHLVDAEDYAEAEDWINRALKVNPLHPEAWAYRSLLLRLKNDEAGAAEARSKGLSLWTNNPAVDHLIGRKLSQKYRFAEGSVAQRQALAFQADYLPARMQLAEDLLRLGEETEGWQLASSVREKDAYDVTAYNLVTLRGTMQKFQTLTNADFVLRMNPQEAALFGDRALALLSKAKARLVEKYGAALDGPTMVEMFPEQKDFGVRTFGMPANPGFLGVCFGKVITATSPAAQSGRPANWEAVLWHEFCHVVTLQLTRNRMPRWLSEGISVFEERQANPAWGQSMNPRFREMILGGDLKPVRELSGAFLSPKSDEHVHFAYFESSLVVEFVVGRFGFDPLKSVLKELGAGEDILVSLARHTEPMDQFEKDFAAYAKGQAEALAPGLDWQKPGGARGAWARAAEALTGAAAVPQESGSPSTNALPGRNYYRLMEEAARRVRDRDWEGAKAPLRTVLEHYPAAHGPDDPYQLLAVAHRGLNQPAEERAALEQSATRNASALDAYLRLMELAATAGDWRAVRQNAERCLAVNPLLPEPYRQWGRSAEELGERSGALEAYQKLLLLDPADPADLHYRLARLLRSEAPERARRHVLQALEDAPRFRAAHALLLELAATQPSEKGPASNSPTKP